jgi:hypothetical protein
MNENNQVCEYCDDGDGQSIFPYYGLAPHVHTKPIDGTEFTGEIPENFSPDGDGMGIYTHCLHCSKRESTIDKFIEDGGFDKAFNDVFGLPVEVVESLKEVT